ncbi:MAG: DUF6144 family protein [Caldisericia bacterium]|nr:DUF6144 family protein [Caldisericia bacterium]
MEYKHKYPFGRIEVLYRELLNHKIDPSVIDQIMDGGEKVDRNTSLTKKAEWIKQAMDKMDKLIEKDLRYKVREKCACCTGGLRLKAMKKIAASGASTEDRIKEINRIHMFGLSTEPEGTKIHVTFGEPGSKCVCTPKGSKEPVSITWCYCCKGHVHKLLEVALEQKLTGKVICSSCSGGENCQFEFEIIKS